VSSCSTPHFFRLSFDFPTPFISLLSVFQVGYSRKYPTRRCSAGGIWSVNYQQSIRTCSGGFPKIFVDFIKLILNFNLDMCVSLPCRICHLSVSSFDFSKCALIVRRMFVRRYLQLGRLCREICSLVIWFLNGRIHSLPRETFSLIKSNYLRYQVASYLRFWLFLILWGNLLKQKSKVVDLSV